MSLKNSLSTFTKPQIILKILALLVILVPLISFILNIFGVNTLDLLPGTELCLFKRFSGIPCPGCGMSKAMILIGQLRFIKAFQTNPFAYMMLIIPLVYLANIKLEVSRPAMILLLVLILTWWIIRLVSGL